LGARLGVALLVSLELGEPAVEPGLRGPTVAAAVGVPEATVHENHLPTRREDEVRLAGKVPSIEPMAIAEAVQEPPNGPFGSGALAPNRRHDPAALLLRSGIGHGSDTGSSARPPKCSNRSIETLSVLPLGTGLDLPASTQVKVFVEPTEVEESEPGALWIKRLRPAQEALQGLPGRPGLPPQALGGAAPDLAIGAV